MGEYAILTPVPVVHLESGLEVCARAGKVAFGTRAYDFFEGCTKGQPVLFYASMNDGDIRPLVTWRGTYDGFVRAEKWTSRDRRMHRPLSALQGDEEQYWAGFYLVSDLHGIDQPIKIGSLADANGKIYGTGFVPEGPIMVTLTP